MTWICECDEIVESRSKYLLHKGICKTEYVNLKKSYLKDIFQDNLNEPRAKGDCALPIIEEPFSDFIPNIGGKYIVGSEISITNHSNGQTSGLVRPAVEPIVVENLIEWSLGDVLPFDELLSDLNISFGEYFVVDDTVNINSTNVEQRTDQTTSLENPTTEFNQLILSDTLCDLPKVS